MIQFFIEKSPTVLLETSKRKHEETFRYNAQNMNNNYTDNDDKFGEYFTEYAYKKYQNEFDLSNKCRALKMTSGIYIMFILLMT